MRLFDENIVTILKREILGKNEYVDSIRLASYGFSIQLCDIKIHCNESVFAKIGGKLHKWQDAPNSAPWGELGRQKAKDIKLINPNLLRIEFVSGDYVEIETTEGDYESVVINFPSTEESLIMEIY